MNLIVGASGTLGNIVARRLLEQGEAVRALSRTPDKITDLQALGAQVVQGDLRDPASLRRACVGATTVIAAAHSLFGRGAERSAVVDDQGHRALIDAAKAADVRHFVYLSVHFADPNHPLPFARYKYQVEQVLKASGLIYTIIRASAFMELHAHQLIGEPILTKGKVTLFGKGESLRNFIAADDVAHYVLLALAKPELQNQTIAIGEPENLSSRQVVAFYEQISGRKAQVSHIPRAVLRTLSLLLRPFHPGLSQVMAAGSYFDEQGEFFDMSPTLQRFPVELTPLERWVRRRVGEG
jgi:NADH dehydrogenase